MSERKERIVELYHISNSFRLGLFPLSVHKDNPNLPLAPFYLHYPQEGEPGSEHLPELFSLIGEEFWEMALGLPAPAKKRRFAPVPRGARSIGEATAIKDILNYPDNLLLFDKVEIDGGTQFVAPESGYEEGDEALAIEDHTSGGRNAKLFITALRASGLVTQTMYNVVNRMQGGTETLKALDVDLMSIFTIYDFLDCSQAGGFIDQQQTDTVQTYIRNNQL